MIKWIFNRTGIRAAIDSYIRFQIHRYLDQNLDVLLRERDWDKQIETGMQYIDLQVSDRYMIRCYAGHLLGKLIYTGQFEQEEIAFVKKFLQPGNVFVDVGANIGLFSLVAADCVGESGSVYAFEPAPKTYDKLLENIYLNSINNIFAIPEGLSNIPGKFEMYDYSNGMDAFSSLAPVLDGHPYTTATVAMNTLDNFIEALPIETSMRIRLIKIDVEGWETNVLAGGTRFLNNPNAPALIVEFTEENARAAGTSGRSIYKGGRQLGYRWYRLEQGKLHPASITKHFPYQNLIALKDSMLPYVRTFTTIA